MASAGLSPAATHASASLLITEAVDRFKATVTVQDQNQIQNTRVDDVIEALRIIQDDLRKSGQDINLVKLYRFVQGLQKYTGAIEALSNGVGPYLPWVWAPIALMLQITSDHMAAFDKLIEAYDKIAETLPQLDRLSNASTNNPTLLAKLALYYTDVLEFHRRAYKFVRRKSWKSFFMTTWRNFDVRFGSILTSLAYHSDLIVQEAQVFDIVEAKKWRDKMDQQTASMESERLYRQRASVIAWLEIDRPMQNDECERLLRGCAPDSCAWILKNEIIESWLRLENQDSLVWLYGKPGAGKSVICASIVESLQLQHFTTLFYFCNHGEKISAFSIFKTFALALIDSHSDSTAVAYTNYVHQHPKVSFNRLRTMMVGSNEKPGLLQGLSTCRIILDGLDECELAEQKLIIDTLTQLLSLSSCKLLICSRDVPEIERALCKKSRSPAMISLSDESTSIKNAIHAFAKGKIEELIDEKPMLRVDSHTMEEIAHIIVDKSNGIFLWAKLVLSLVRDADSVSELHDALITMPQELSELYGRILDLLCTNQTEERTERMMRTLAWITFAKRPLMCHEILHGVALTSENPVLDTWNRLDRSAIDRCKPLIEELPNGSIVLIHSTLQEYLSAWFKQSIGSWYGSMAFSCVATINKGLLLVDPDTSQEAKLLLVVSGSLSLLPYSIDFWLDHLLDHATTMHIAQDSPLGKKLNDFYNHHSHVVQRLGRSTLARTDSPQLSSDSRIVSISHLPISALCLSLRNFRAVCIAVSIAASPDFESFAKIRDPTLLGDLSSQFRICVESLLSLTWGDGVSRGRLGQFQAQYRQHAFPCRFTPCTAASLGFPTISLRDEHEQLHVKRLFCSELNCLGSRVVFEKQRDLARHNKIHHAGWIIVVPPRVRDSSQVAISNDAASQQVKSLLPPRVRDSSQVAISSDAASQQVKSPLSPHSNESIPPEEASSSLAYSRNRNWKINETRIPFGSVMELDEMEDALDQLQISDPLSSKVRYRYDWGVLHNQPLSKFRIKLEHTLQHKSVVCGVSISRSGNYLATSCDREAHIFDLRTGQLGQTFNHFPKEQGSNYVRSISFSPDENEIATGSDDTMVRMWKLGHHNDNTEPWRSFSGHTGMVFSVEYAYNGTFVASTSGDRTARVWDLSTEHRHKQFTASDDLTSVSVSPNSCFLVAGCTTNKIYVWDIDKETLLCFLDDPGSSVYGVSYSPGGEYLVTVYMDKSLRLWGTMNQIPVHRLGNMKLHKDFVLDAVFTGDSRWIISASRDGGAVLWDSMTLQPHAVIIGHRGPINRMATASNEPTFATASGDKTVRVWSYDVQSESAVQPAFGTFEL